MGLLVFGVFPMFGELSETISSTFDIQIILFLGMYFIVTFVVGLPLSYYGTFSIEERYGLLFANLDSKSNCP